MALDMTYFEEMEAKIPKGKVRTRFAPSPTGYMHVGNLRTALYTWLIARHSQGTFILRIEDTDQTRQVEGATEVIYRTLAECHLDHDEGPDVGGPVAPYIQTERRDTYGKYAQLLVEKGHAYYCFCEKAESEEDSGEFDRAEDPCRALSPAEAQARVDAGEPYVIRQRIPAGGSTTFHDAIFGDITVENKTYVHCSPVMRDAQHKMSKRHGDPSYEDLKAQGFLTDAILNYVALLGWSPKGDLAEQEIFTLDQLVDAFELSGVSKSPAIFDIEKLTHFNALYLRAMAPEEFAKVAEPYIRQTVKDPKLDAAKIAGLLQARCEKLTDIPEKVDFFDALPDYDVNLFANKKSKSTLDSSREMLSAAIGMLANLPSWSEAMIHDSLVGLAEGLGVKNALLMWPVRIAAAGKSVTPGGAVEICHILGREETVRRLKLGLDKLSSFS